MKHIIDFNEYSLNEEGLLDGIAKLGRSAWRAGRRLFGKGGKAASTALPKLGLLDRVNKNQYTKIWNALTRNPSGLRYLNFEYAIANKIDDVYSQLSKLGYATRDIELLKLFIKQIGEKKFMRFWNAVSKNKLQYEKMTQEQLMTFIQDKLVEIEKMSRREFKKAYPRVRTQSEIDRETNLIGWGTSFLLTTCLIFVLSKCGLTRPKKEEEEGIFFPIDLGGGGGGGMPQDKTKVSKPKTEPKIIRGDEKSNIPPEVKQKIEKVPLLKDTVSRREPVKPKPVPDLGSGSESGKGPGTGGGEGSGKGTGEGPGKGSGKGEGSGGSSIYTRPGVSMGGWMWKQKPDVPASSESGIIVFKVTVKSSGYVESISVVQTTVSQELTNKYKKILQETTFYTRNPTGEGGSGTVTFKVN